jgi:hypothetical protein
MKDMRQAFIHWHQNYERERTNNDDRPAFLHKMGVMDILCIALIKQGLGRQFENWIKAFRSKKAWT